MKTAYGCLALVLLISQLSSASSTSVNKALQTSLREHSPLETQYGVRAPDETKFRDVGHPIEVDLVITAGSLRLEPIETPDELAPLEDTEQRITRGPIVRQMKSKAASRQAASQAREPSAQPDLTGSAF